jgi:hypothetical protein
MRLAFLALVIALGLAACGQVDRDEPGAASGPLETSEPPPAGSEPPEAGIEPPRVVLESEAGRQIGVRGGSCVTNFEIGKGLCVDIAHPEAKQASVVRPGETITIALDGAQAVKAEECGARDMSCIGEARVVPLGCKSATVARIFLDRGSETERRVTLEPGAYELQVFVYFEADDGRAGDVSAALGLVVDPDAEPAIVPAPAAAAVCR